MKLPVAIRFAGLVPSEAVELAIRERVRRAERLHPGIASWRITVEQDHKHRYQVRPFGVRIEVKLPRHELVVSRVHDEDVHVALRDAFDAIGQQIGDHARVGREKISGF